MLPSANPKVIYKALADGAVLLSTTDEVYFGLNEVGARVWEHLPPVLETLDQLCATIGAEYPDADPAAIRSDVAHLLDELAKYELVLPRDSQAQKEHGVTSGDREAGQAEPYRVG
jgi:hypothetical protein